MESFGQDFDLSRILNNNQCANLDDFIDFRIYFDNLPQCSNNKRRDRNGITEAESYAFDRLNEFSDYWEDLCSEYAWTCCPLVLEVVPEKDEVNGRDFNDINGSIDSSMPKVKNTRPDAKSSALFPTHLLGHVRVGDNIEEEWFVVHLLRELTSRVPDISVSVCDADGEILLIESAINLPSWLNPETSRNRVWLRHGALQIIPKTLPTSSLDMAEVLPISVDQAIRCLVSDQRGMFTAKPAVQKSIHRRTKPFQSIAKNWQCSTIHPRVSSTPDPTVSPGFNSASLCERHCIRLVVPLPIALLLRRFPHLLGVALDYLPPAVDVAAKYSREMARNRSGSENVLEDGSQSELPTRLPVFDCSDDSVPTVCIRVALNRCQIARLKQLKFHLPAHFTATKWRSPSQRTSKLGCRELSYSEMKLRGAIERGAKICLGLLAAFMSTDRGTSSCLAFFWDSQLRGNKIKHRTFERLQRFVSLLEISTPDNQTTLMNEKVRPKQLAFSTLRSLVNSKSGDSIGSAQRVPNIDQVRFRDVFKHCYSAVIAANGNCSSLHEFCECPNRVPGELSTVPTELPTVPTELSTVPTELPIVPTGILGLNYGCGGVDCCPPSDDEQWLELSSCDVDKAISEKQKEDRFLLIMEQELSSLDNNNADTNGSMGSVHGQSKVSSSSEHAASENPISMTALRDSDFLRNNDQLALSKRDETGVQIEDLDALEQISPTSVSRPTEMNSLDAEMNAMFNKFSELLNTSSGLGGINGEGHKSNKRLSPITKRQLREKLPGESD